MKMRWTSLMAAALLVGVVACGDDDPKGNNTTTNNATTNNIAPNSTSPNSTSPNSTTPNNVTTANNNNGGGTADVNEVEPNGVAEGDTPTSFELGQSFGGTLAEGSGETADVDIFSFQAEAGQVATFTIESIGEGLQDLGESQLAIVVISEDESVVRQLLGNEGLSSRELFLPVGGTYAVQVVDIRSQETLVGGPDATYVIGTSVGAPEPDALAVPGSLDGDLGDGSIAAYTVNVSEATVVEVETFAGRLDTPSGLDTVLVVFDPAAGALVSTNDDLDIDNEIYDSGLAFSAEAGKDYLVVVDAYNATESGNFRIETGTTDDSAAAPTVVAAGDTVAGDIAASEADVFDTDYFEITLQRNEVVRVEVTAADQLQPNLRVLFDGFAFAEGQPVDGVAAVEIAAGDFEDPQTFAVTLDDFRNTPPNEGTPENVGGAGFDYEVTITTVTWTPQAVTLPYSDTGTITTVGTTDWYSFTVPAGQILIADVITTATGFSPQLSLLNDQNFDEAVDAPYVVGADADLTVTLGVRDEFYRGFATADYLVDFSTITPTATTETEPNDDIAGAQAITLPSAVSGVTTGTNTNDFNGDFFSFTGVAGQTLTVFTGPGAEAATDDADTIVALFDGTGTELDRNDDISFGNTFSEIVIELPADGTYTISVEPYCSDMECSNGDYTLTAISN